MLMPLDPTFIVSAVPGDVATAVAVAGATAIGWLARRNVVVEDAMNASEQRHSADLLAIHTATLEYERERVRAESKKRERAS